MSTPRVVASDLDGTVVRSDGTFSDRTRAAMAAVEAAGASFVMVTGRPVRWMHQVAEQTGHRGLAVCANGALLYDLHTEEVVRSWLLASAPAQEVVRALRDALPGIAFAVERLHLGFAHEPEYRPRWDSTDPLTQGPVEQLLSDDVVKLLARHEHLGSDELLAAARSAVPEGAELTHSSSDGLLEISAVGVSKASGLATVCAELSVAAADVVAFGDMPNDRPMLAWAGRGVAVANAHPEVLAAADEVTGSNDEDGVADYLSRWF
ncbi:MAG TPA: Cof-type HAD-IIB family hydrolase [Mycobacteriales bacterium]|nr:Cof-type HAD-IIB family hydrolase [Mycobacteriales bacterium]